MRFPDEKPFRDDLPVSRSPSCQISGSSSRNYVRNFQSQKSNMETLAQFQQMLAMANLTGDDGLFSLFAQAISKLQADVEANRRNVIQLSNTILDLSKELAEAKSTIATLTKEAIVNETCEREEESKKVLLRNVPKNMIRKIGGRQRNLMRSVNSYVKSLSGSLLPSFDERDLRYTKIVSNRNHELSILIHFTSSSDAQKFKHRLDLREGRSLSMRGGKTRLQRWNSVRAEIPDGGESVDKDRGYLGTPSSSEDNDRDLSTGRPERKVRFELPKEERNKEKLQKEKRQPYDPWGAWNDFVGPGPILAIPLIEVTPMTNPPPTKEGGYSAL